MKNSFITSRPGIVVTDLLLLGRINPAVKLKNQIMKDGDTHSSYNMI